MTILTPPYLKRAGEYGIAATAVLLLATPATAKDFTCTFHTVCSNDHPCGERELLLSVASEGGRTIIDSPGSDFESTERFDAQDNIFSYVTELTNSAKMLTIFSDGDALFTTHVFLDRALSQTYLGDCKSP